MNSVIRVVSALFLLLVSPGVVMAGFPLEPRFIDDGGGTSGGGTKLFSVHGPSMIAVGRSVRLAAAHSGGWLPPLSVSWFNQTPDVVLVSSDGMVHALAPGAWTVSASYLGLYDTVRGHVGEPERCNDAGTDTPVSEPQPPAPPRKRLILLSQYDPDPGGGGIATNAFLAGSAQGLVEQYEGDEVILIVLGKNGVPSFAKLDSALAANGLRAGELLSIDIIGHGDRVKRDVSPTPGIGDPVYIKQVQLDLGTGQYVVPETTEGNETGDPENGDHVGTNAVKNVLGMYLSGTGSMTLHHCYSAEEGDEDAGVAKALADALGRSVTGYLGTCETTSQTTMEGRHRPPDGLKKTATPDSPQLDPAWRDPTALQQSGSSPVTDLIVRTTADAPGIVIECSVISATTVDVTMFDVLGHIVRRLGYVPLSPGKSRIFWDGFDANGRCVPSGVYFAQVLSGPTVRTARAVILR